MTSGSQDSLYERIVHRWTDTLENTAGQTGIDSLLVMRSTPTHMVTAASAGPGRDTYHPGDAGPKSVNPGCHKLYCEQVVNEGQPLEVRDARNDPEWEGNEDLVQFGLGTYLGFPLRGPDHEILGTICALHHEPFDFDAGEPSLRTRLQTLQRDIESELMAPAE